MAHICDECAQRSHISVTSSEPEEFYTPENGKQKHKCNHHCARTPGTTPTSKRAKKVLFCSPRTKEKIEEIHHYQKHQIDLQRQLHYGQRQLYDEQQRTSATLSILERMASFLCASNKNDVYQPMTQGPSSSTHQNSWDRNYNRNEGKKEKWSPWKNNIKEETNDDH